MAERSQEAQRMAQGKSFMSPLDMGMALAPVGMIFLMVLPIPAFLLDLAFVLSISLSLTILIIALTVDEPMDFSAFPTVLLFVTLFRLSLNVASTRLILLRGDEGASAAGRVIEAFGQFVVGGNYVVGFIVFVILVVINFVVITKGATRIAEVAARFTLDAMPGKQMAIDADLNAGLISEAEARQRRHRVQKEGDFHGAMDGASKFVRGDAIAGIIILAVNILGGFFIGILQAGLSVADAARIYSLLSVGDGLVSQIPALIVSTAAGMVITRTASTGNLGLQLGKQLFSRPQVMAVVAGILTLFSLIPGFPFLPFIFMAGVSGWISQLSGRLKEDKDGVKEGEKGQDHKSEGPEEPTRPAPLDLLELEVGYELIPLVDGDKGGVVGRIRSLRRQFLSDKGFLVPQIHIRDNLLRKSKEYMILVKGVEAGRGELRPGRFLAMNAGGVHDSTQIVGEETHEPAFGLPAVWVSSSDKERAEAMGYTVVDPETVLITHLSEMVKRFSPQLLTRQQVQSLLDGLAQEHPKVVEELIPHHLTVGGVQKVLQNLLHEDVSIRDLLSIVESLADHAPDTKNQDDLTEAVREALSRTITSSLRSPEGVIPLMTVDAEIERVIRESVQQGVAIEPQAAQRIVNSVKRAVETFGSRGLLPVFLTSPGVRRHLRQLLSRYLQQIAVLSYSEIADGVKIQSLGAVRWSDGT